MHLYQTAHAAKCADVMPLMREVPGVAEHIPKPSEWDRCEIAALREAHRAILEIFALPAFAEGPRYHREDWQRITNKLGDGNGGFDIDLIEDVAGLHFQRVAMKAVHQQLWTDAVNDEALPDQTRARLRCAAQPGAHAWRTIEAVRPHQAWQAGNAMVGSTGAADQAPHLPRSSCVPEGEGGSGGGRG